MPRRGRGSSGGGRSARSPRRPAPRAVNHAPRPARAQSGNHGSLFRTVAEGIAFGAGSAVAHRAVNSVFGPRSIQHETVVNGPPAAATAPMANSLGGDECNAPTKAFQDCLNSNLPWNIITVDPMAPSYDG